MLKKLLNMACISAVLCTAAAQSCYAAQLKQISSVTVSLLPEDTIYPGDMIYGVAPTASGNAVVSEYTWNESSSTTPQTQLNYTITLRPNEGYQFAPKPGISVKACSKVTAKSISTDSIVLSCQAYPIYRLTNPTGFELNGAYASWNKVPYAKKYNVTIYYINEDGKQKSVKKEISENHYDFGEYEKDGEAYISVQAVPDKDDLFMAPSQYIFAADGAIDTAKSPKTTGNMPSVSLSKTQKGDSKTYGKKASTSSSSSTLSGKKTSNSSNVSYTILNSSGKTGGDGWAGAGMEWYYTKSGKPLVEQWITETDGRRYYLGKDGIMATGWQVIGDKWYLFDQTPGRAIGAMLTGWQNSNGKLYFLEPDPSSTDYGAMYINRLTPDGFMTGADGAAILP